MVYRMLRVRQHLNGIHRQLSARSLFTDSKRTSHTPEEQAHFLRASDQNALRETQAQLDRLVAHVAKITEYVNKLSTAIQVPVTVKSIQRTGATKPEVHYTISTTPYTNGLLRQRILELPAAFKNVHARAHHVRNHLIDLQHEPYPSSDTKNGLAVWEAEVNKMSKVAKEDTLKNLEYEEQAAGARLRQNADKLVSTVKTLQAVQRKNPGEKVDLDAPRSNPFGGKGEGGQKESAARRADGSTAKTEDVAPAKPVALGIQDLQARLEAQLRSGQV